MALVSLNMKPSEKQLKSFGLVALIMLNLIGLVLLGLDKISGQMYLIFAIAGVVTFILGIISTRLVKPIYLTLITLTFPIGWIVSHLMMALFYYGIITAVGLVFRIINRDPLCRKFDTDADTYWVRSKAQRSAKDYFRQF